MQKFKFNINGKGYEAIVSPKIAAVKPSSSSADFVDAPAQPITGNAGSIKSPLPGNVSKVKVKEGQAVKAGEVLMTLEAMKMENEIMAPAAGTVKKIYVTEGKAVQQGEALIDLE